MFRKLLPYLSYRGRTGRLNYWLTSLGIYIVFLVVLLLAAGLAAAIPVLGGILGAGGVILCVWAGSALLFRRLHDRNKPGWWLIPMYVPMILLGGLAEAASSDPAVKGLFSLLSLPFSIWVLVELGFLRGTAGENRFGPDPLQPPMAVVFS